MKRIFDFTTSNNFVPVILFIVTVLSAGLLLPWLGFYWDDWAKILVARLWGLSAYLPYYAEDRPLSGWTHILFTPLLGTTPLPWHVFTLLLRWLTAWGAWWCLTILWPNARRQNLIAALIFLVHPVFISQAAAVTFHQQWLQFALYFLSFGLMLAAQRRAGRGFWLLTSGSLAAMLAQLSVTEYFVPLELLRPFGLFFLFAQTEPKPLRKTLRAWAPYLLVTAVYVIWRFFLLQLPGADPYRAETLYAFLQSPLQTLGSLLNIMLVDETHILLNAWVRHFNLDFQNLTRVEQLILALEFAVLLVSTLYVTYFQRRNDPAETSQNEAAHSRWPRQVFIFGLAAVLLGPVPAWITGRQVVFDFHSDRYAMPAMFGAALLAVSALEWMVQRPVQRAFAASMLIAIGLAAQLHIANDYRWTWTDQTRFFWELSWRAPGLKSPTALYMEEEPYPNQGLFSTSAALNLMYPQQSQNGNLSYWMFALRPRYNNGAPADLNAISMNTTFRTLHFEGSTPDTLLLYKNPSISNCLWVLSARDADHPYLSDLVKDFLPVSNLEQISTQTQPGYPPADILGAEPARTTWCYYFEKADLARQQEDWPAAAALANQALEQGYTPDTIGSNSPHEWMPLIEGLARTGSLQTAANLTRQSYALDARYRAMLCKLWDTIPEAQGTDARAAVDQALLCGEIIP